jgi:hypothetical protein
LILANAEERAFAFAGQQSASQRKKAKSRKIMGAKAIE